MNNFEKVIKKLEQFGKDRPSPEDHLYNISKCVEGNNMSGEEWANFYRYITCQAKEEFEYLTRDKIVTLGDLGEEKLQEIEDSLAYGPDKTLECYQNGIETLMIVKNVEGNKEKENNNGKKPLATACSQLPRRPQGCVTENCTQGSFQNVQQVCSSDEKEA